MTAITDNAKPEAGYLSARTLSYQAAASQQRQLQAAVTPNPQIAAAAAAAAAAGGAQVCEVCMRRFGSVEALERHVQFSDLHKQNVAKLRGEA